MKASLFSVVAAVLLASTAAFAAPVPFDHPGPADRFDDRASKNFNYGYAPKHRVTPQEQTRWEAAHRNDHSNRSQRFGSVPDHRVTPQERARWVAAHKKESRR